MVKSKFLSAVLGMALLYVACRSVIPFSMERVDNKSSSLSLDGFYLSRDSLIDNVYVLYRNGTLINYNGRHESINSHRKSLSDTTLNWNRPFWWGVYKVEQDSIYIEEWYGVGRPYTFMRKRGEILSDTSFSLYGPPPALVTPSGVIKPTKKYPDLYGKFGGNFRFFPSLKPDSTNSFIK